MSPPRAAPASARACVSAVQVGRDEELASLVSAVASPPSLAVIDGEAGIGKSRMIRELMASPDLAGTRILIGHCEHLQEPLPLAPLLDVFHHNADQIPPGRLSRVVGALAPLVPEAADRLPPPPPTLNDQRAARHRVFRAATELLDNFGPAMLVLEDLHWAENGMFDFLRYLVSHQPEQLCVVVTARSDPGALPIGESFARAPSGPPLSINLTPLDRDEVGELALGILNVDVPDVFAAALYEKSGGIPFVIEEVLRTLLEQFPADVIPDRPDVLDSLAVPTALRDVVLQRLAVLSTTTSSMIGLAAVLGPTVDADLLAAVSGQSAAEVAAALTEAHAAGLLQGEQDGQSRFRHVLAQQIIYEAVPGPTRRWLHGTVAQTLQRRVHPNPVARLAHHYGRAGDTRSFVRYAEQAADLAVTHGDDATAAGFLLRAMRETEIPVNVRLRLATKLGRAAVDGLAHTEAVPVLEQLLGTQQLPADVMGELRFALGRLLRQQGLAHRGYTEIEAAVPDLEDQPGLQARALAVLTAPETVIDRHVDDHTARCDQAADAARRSGSHEVELAVRIARASLLLEQGDPSGWVLVGELRRDDVLLASPREHARACLNWAQAALHIGHVSRAEDLLAEGRGVVAEAEYLRLSGVVHLVAAGVDWAAGRWDGLAGRARDLAHEPSEFGAASLDGRLLHCLMLVATGGSSEAVGHLEDLVESAEWVGAVWPLIRARTVLARVLVTTGDPQGGCDQATAALATARQKGNWVWAADTAEYLVDGLIALGRGGEIRPLVSELEAHLGDADAPIAQSALLGAQARAAHAQGNDRAAESLLQSSRQILADNGLRYDEARASEMLGEWWCERGADGGAAMLEHALRAYGTLRAGRDIARVCATMRRHGVAVPYPWRGGRRSHGLDLSNREREVALLAAAGKTNPEIATDLYLSRRTIETHVSNALRKLGCRSRSELASHAALYEELEAGIGR